MVWTKYQEKYLKENYQDKFYLDISKTLNKSLSTIKRKLRSLGLKSGGKSCPPDAKGEKNGNWKGGISRDSYRYKKIDAQKYPSKHKARIAVYRAVRAGTLHKPTNCEECKKKFSKDKIEGHHEDYDKPLEVRWLCRKCHREADKKL